MKRKIEDANNYYHQLYPNEAIFFKLPQGYALFGAEAVKLSSLLCVRLHTFYDCLCIMIPTNIFLDKAEILNMCGRTFRTISYFDDKGNLAIPDIPRLIEEQEIDY